MYNWFDFMLPYCTEFCRSPMWFVTGQGASSLNTTTSSRLYLRESHSYLHQPSDPWPYPTTISSCSRSLLCAATRTSQPPRGQRAQALRVLTLCRGNPEDTPAKTCLESTCSDISSPLCSFSRSENFSLQLQIWVQHIQHCDIWVQVILMKYTFGSVARYDSGTAISARMLLLIAIAALWIWFAHSRFLWSSLRDFSRRP